MYRPVKSLVSVYNTLQNSIPSRNRVFEILDQTPAVVDADDAVALETFSDSIRVDDVSFSYDGEREVLRNVSFSAKVGTTTAIVGHTGSGKSTLMDLLSRTMDPTEGQIWIDGVGLESLKLQSYREKLAVVSQSTFVFNDTVRENIRYGRLDATDSEVEKAAQAARVHDEIMAFPDGYDHLAGEMGAKLSGGQLQRLTLARAMIRRPAILLLDEATSALDTQTEHLVQAAIGELEKTCTTFVIAHRLSTVRHADQILVLHDGALVEYGTHDELAEITDGHYAALLAQLST
jgi:ABC-type multidrug transport system fused ATPase/permease subunit